MKLKIGDDPVYVNTMPQIAMPGIEGAAGRTTAIPLTFETTAVLPKGSYQAEVTLNGPDGQKYVASVDFEVRHAR